MNRTTLPGHAPVRSVHHISQFQSGAAVFPHQQQMMQKLRMSGSADTPVAPGQAIVEGGIGSGSMMGPRFGGMATAQERFSNPPMMVQHDENAPQHLHQQQMIQRMALMRQSQPSNTGPMNQMEMMQSKWQHQPQPMDASNYPLEQQGHQFYSHVQGQGNNRAGDVQAMHQPTQSPMHQMQTGVIVNTPQNPASTHQHYNPALMNRFSSQMTPQQQQQQQQFMFQQMQQQQASNRFPTSTSLEAAGITGISPLALQQGLLNAEKLQADNPPLVHPSLQGVTPKGRLFKFFT